jgi:tetratricopeptide (TPR) repeat protein
MLLPLLVAGIFSCATAPAGKFAPEEREEYSRMNLQRARVLRNQGELVKAELVLRRVIAVDPDNHRAHVMRIELLEELGRQNDVVDARQALTATSKPLPDSAVAVDSTGVLVAIAGSDLSDGRTGAFLSAVADAFAGQLAERAELRLPQARVTRFVPSSVAEARAMLEEWQPRSVLTLQGKRAFCGDSGKDGRFAVAMLDVTAARPDRDEVEHIPIKKTLYDLDPIRCPDEIAARALEGALAEPRLQTLLEAPGVPGEATWSSPVIRRLFPGLDAHIEQSLDQARKAMSEGRFEEALTAFQHAASIDPEDPTLEGQLRAIQATVAMRRELQAASGSFVAEMAREAEAAHARHRAEAPLEGDFVHVEGIAELPPVPEALPPVSAPPLEPVQIPLDPTLDSSQ